MQELNYLKDILTGASLILSGQIDFMVLFLFLLVITRVYAPFDQSLALIADMFISQVSADRINEIYETPIAKGAETFHPQGHDIIFDHVGFAYDKKQVLRDVSFTAKEGEVTALVGPSGSGKAPVRVWPPACGILRPAALPWAAWTFPRWTRRYFLPTTPWCSRMWFSLTTR